MKEIISNKQGIILFILFVLGSAVIVVPGAEAEKDIWLAGILGLIMVLPAVYIYARLHFLFPGKDLYDMLKLIFGKKLGSLISIIYIWFSIHLGAMVLFNFAVFINTVGLSETPTLLPRACIIILCVFGAKLGIEVIGRWSEFFFYIIIFIIFFIMLLSSMNFRIEHISPVLSKGIEPVIKGALSIFSFPFSETVVFIGIFSSLKNKGSYYRVYFTGILSGAFIFLILSLVNTLVLGPYIVSLNYFPTYITVSRISIGEFLQRLEILVSVAFLITGFVEISLCIISAAKGVSKLFNLNDYRFAVSPMALLVLNLSFFVFRDIMEIHQYSEIDHYYKILIGGIIPLIILIGAEIKVRSRPG